MTKRTQEVKQRAEWTWNNYPCVDPLKRAGWSRVDTRYAQGSFRILTVKGRWVLLVECKK